MRRMTTLFKLHVDEAEASEGLRQTRNDRSVALRVIVEFEKRRGHQFVVSGDGEKRLFLQLDEEKLPMLLRLRDVRRNVRILGRLEIRPPPISNGILNGPNGRFGGVGFAQRVRHKTL